MKTALQYKIQEYKDLVNYYDLKTKKKQEEADVFKDAKSTRDYNKALSMKQEYELILGFLTELQEYRDKE